MSVTEAGAGPVARRGLQADGGRPLREHLITFSNHSFYAGRLVTFPGATDVAADVGVELFPAWHVPARHEPGQPRRSAGGVRAGPLSRRNHPGLTLGVVAFSEAQAAAIETELDALRQISPELDPGPRLLVIDDFG